MQSRPADADGSRKSYERLADRDGRNANLKTMECLSSEAALGSGVDLSPGSSETHFSSQSSFSLASGEEEDGAIVSARSKGASLGGDGPDQETSCFPHLSESLHKDGECSESRLDSLSKKQESLAVSPSRQTAESLSKLLANSCNQAFACSLSSSPVRHLLSDKKLRGELDVAGLRGKRLAIRSKEDADNAFFQSGDRKLVESVSSGASEEDSPQSPTKTNVAESVSSPLLVAQRMRLGPRRRASFSEHREVVLHWGKKFGAGSQETAGWEAIGFRAGSSSTLRREEELRQGRELQNVAGSRLSQRGPENISLEDGGAGSSLDAISFSTRVHQHFHQQHQQARPEQQLLPFLSRFPEDIWSTLDCTSTSTEASASSRGEECEAASSRGTAAFLSSLTSKTLLSLQGVTCSPLPHCEESCGGQESSSGVLHSNLRLLPSASPPTDAGVDPPCPSLAVGRGRRLCSVQNSDESDKDGGLEISSHASALHAATPSQSSPPPCLSGGASLLPDIRACLFGSNAGLRLRVTSAQAVKETHSATALETEDVRPTRFQNGGSAPSASSAVSLAFLKSHFSGSSDQLQLLAEVGGGSNFGKDSELALGKKETSSVSSWRSATEGCLSSARPATPECYCWTFSSSSSLNNAILKHGAAEAKDAAPFASSTTVYVIPEDVEVRELRWCWRGELVSEVAVSPSAHSSLSGIRDPLTQSRDRLAEEDGGVLREGRSQEGSSSVSGNSYGVAGEAVREDAGVEGGACSASTWRGNGRDSVGSTQEAAMSAVPALLCFHRGERVEVLVHHRDGWVYGRIRDQPSRRGWFPFYTLFDPGLGAELFYQRNVSPSPSSPLAPSAIAGARSVSAALRESFGACSVEVPSFERILSTDPARETPACEGDLWRSYGFS